MKEIKVGKLILVSLGTQIISAICMFVIFGDAVDINLLAIVCSGSNLLALFKIGGVNKELVFERMVDFKKKFKFKEIIVVVITQMLLSMAVSLIILAIMYYVYPEYAIGIMKEETFSSDTSFQLFTMIIMVSIMAPLLEEIIFRKILFTRFLNKIGFMGGAILSSVLFGLLHMELAMIGAMVFGVTGCILYRKYNNILIPMSVHFINNSIVTVFVVIGTLTGSAEPVDYTMTASDIRFNLIVGVVFLVISMMMFVRFISKNRIYLKKDENTNTLTI